MIFAKYDGCDPLKSGKINAIDQLVPFYVMETFSRYTTFVGIFVAGVFAASLGTVAACLSSLSAVTLEDLLISGINIKITPEKCTQYAKWMNFGYGVASFCLIFLVEGRGILQATLTLNGLVGGILLGLFCLGIFFKRANMKGALIGGLLATITVVTLGILALTNAVEEPFLDTSTAECDCKFNATMLSPDIGEATESAWYTSIYKVSYMWYSMIGTLLTIFFGLTISILTQSYDDSKIRKIASSSNLGNMVSNSLRSSARKISTNVQTLTHDLSETTSKLEHKFRDAVQSYRNLDENGDLVKPELKGTDNPALDISNEHCRK